MAFLQTDYPPSTAPHHMRPAAYVPVRRRVLPVARPSRWRQLGRLALIAAAIGAVALPGYMVGRNTESLALGILASDFCFLIAVAIGSSFSRR